MPVSMLRPGETQSIKRITGRDEVRQHLAELGFVAGEEVVVISEIGGNMLLQVKGTRIALDRSMANRILV